jgi:4,5-dihydroxyphthalate decarboxylase
MLQSKLRTVLDTRGPTAALKDGVCRPDGFAFDFDEGVTDITSAFRRMVRNAEFDVCEMALSTYLCAREHGKRLTALPVFLVRAFHHGALLVHRNNATRSPKAFEGRRVGVSGGYTTTTGMWVRGLLQEAYGVDLERVTWVLSGDEHVAEYRAPANVVSADGRKLLDLLLAGEIDALIGGGVNHPDVVPLVPDGLAAGLQALQAHGYYPINHLVVVRDELLQETPQLAAALFKAFTQAQDMYVEALRAPSFIPQTPEQQLHCAVLQAKADPLPYGVALNQRMLESAIDHAMVQRIITQRPDLQTLFAPTL